MYLMDVNILVYAHRTDAANHSVYRQWLESVVNSPASFGYSELVLSGFLRIVTHPKVFEVPSTLLSAIRFTEQIKSVSRRAMGWTPPTYRHQCAKLI